MVREYPPIPAEAPFLFENQDKPFAGDTFMEEEFLRLRDRFGIKEAIETGTCYGSTTIFLMEHFEGVTTIEINAQYRHIAGDRLALAFPDRDLLLIVGNSAEQMDFALGGTTNATLCFLDAHFEHHCPLLDELKAIAHAGIKPVIVIHDFKVPGRPDLGFDTWNGQAFTFEWVRPYLDNIYGPQGYDHYYNTEATGAKRGVLYVTPK